MRLNGYLIHLKLQDLLSNFHVKCIEQSVVKSYYPEYKLSLFFCELCHRLIDVYYLNIVFIVEGYTEKFQNNGILVNLREESSPVFNETLRHVSMYRYHKDFN